MNRIPHKPYPELRSVLETFVAGVQNSLKRNFVGAYLVGSLASGDFDLDSDVDFQIITRDELADPEIESLQEVHFRIRGLNCYPAKHLEGSYISKALLDRADLVGVRKLLYIDNGNASLEHSVHDNQWHVRWILRERGIILHGPDPKTLLQPVPVEALRSEMLTALHELKTQFDSEIGKPLGYFNTRYGQSFAVLTCCRMLHTLQSGVVNSKLSGVRWVVESLNPEWQDLLRHAWTERIGVRFCEKIHQPAEVSLLQQSANFMAYAQSESLARHAKSRG